MRGQSKMQQKPILFMQILAGEATSDSSYDAISLG